MAEALACGNQVIATARQPGDIERTLRGSLAEWNHAQPGDPVKAARAIVDLAELSDPPLRIQLGADSVGRIEAKLGQVRTELDRWRKVSLSSAH